MQIKTMDYNGIKFTYTPSSPGTRYPIQESAVGRDTLFGNYVSNSVQITCIDIPGTLHNPHGAAIDFKAWNDPQYSGHEPPKYYLQGIKYSKREWFVKATKVGGYL